MSGIALDLLVPRKVTHEPFPQEKGMEKVAKKESHYFALQS